MADEVAEQGDERSAYMRQALLLVEQALDILDLAGAPEDIGAHLDMGRHRLEAYLHLEE